MNKKWIIIFISVIVVCWAVDLSTKLVAIDNLATKSTISGKLSSNGKTVSAFFDIFRFRFTENKGGVFGIAQGNSLIFHIITGLGILFLGYFFFSTKDKTFLFVLSMSFILGGAFGNFTDRFFREGVADFIEMGIGNARYPYIYNMADVFITTGAILLFFAFRELSKIEKAKKLEESSKTSKI